MAIKRTIIEEDQADNPTVVRSTKRIVNPNIHTAMVDAREEVVDAPDSSTVTQTRVVHEPLIKTEHPQQIYEKKKTIFRSWQIIWYILAVIEIVIGFRLTLKAIGANPLSGFVSLIYAISNPLAAPFAGIIKASVNANSIIEWSTMIAALVYLLVAWGLVNLIHMARPVTPEEVEQTV